MSSFTTGFLAAILAAGIVPAQQDGRIVPWQPARLEPGIAAELPRPAAVQQRAAIGEHDVFYAPIRGGRDDSGHVYGIWASGPNYKVSFHRGMEFYPMLGASYPHHLPVGWTTTSVRVGDHELLGADEQPDQSSSDWRYEYRYAHFTESYDVLRAGVEQLFTLHEHPGVAGDLVVRGRLVTDLISSPGPDGALALSDAAGNEVVRYGAAVAIDAAGRRSAMTTACDGAEVTLRLGHDALAGAVFPVVVDPLWSSVVLSMDSIRPAGSLDVARDDVADELMVVYGRRMVLGDYDAYARVTDDNFAGSTVVWTDITTSWSTPSIDVAFVGGPDRWIVVFQRSFPGGVGAALRYHVRDTGDHTPRTGGYFLASSAGNLLWAPDVGGTDGQSSGDHALVTYQFDVGLRNTTNSAAVARLVNVRTLSVGPAIDLESRPNNDAEVPRVNQISAGGLSSWICVWTQYNNSIAGDDWDIVAARVDSTGVVRGKRAFGDGSATVHNFLPAVAGRNGRYMLAYGQDPNTSRGENGWAEELWAQRIDWPETSTSGVARATRRFYVGGSSYRAYAGDIAHDNVTASHWAVAQTTRSGAVLASRLGYDAGLCERPTVYYDPPYKGYSAGITFNDNDVEFPLVYTTTEDGSEPFPVYGTRFAYTNFPYPAHYGTQCGPAIIRDNAFGHARKPHRGQQFFEIRITNCPDGALGAIFLGTQSGSFPLLGCYLDVSGTLVSVPLGAVGTTAILPLPIPSKLSGHLYFQYWYVDPAGPHGLGATQGLDVEVR